MVQAGNEPVGIVAVGVEISYTIRITNTGSTALAVVPLQDLYDASFLTFVRANPAPNSSVAGSLFWFNLAGFGNLQPGQGTVVTITFRTRATTDSQPNRQTLNFASVANAQDEFGQRPADQASSAPVRIARSAVAVEKTILAPALSAIGVGADVTFGIRVANVGQVTLAQVPLYDLYEADVLQYRGTSISSPRVTVSGVDGELFWADITHDLGEIRPGQAVQFTVTFRMIAQRITTNLVRVDNVIDANNDAVPPAQGVGSVEVIPAAAPIYRLFAPLVGGPSAPSPTATPTPTMTPTMTPTPTPTPTSVVSEVDAPCPSNGCPVSGLAHPKGIAVHEGMQMIFLTSRDTNTLIKFDPTTNQVVATVPTGSEPWDVVIQESHNEVYVSNFGSGDVWVYDANTLAVKKKIGVGQNPAMMELFPFVNTVAVIVRGYNQVVMLVDGNVSQRLDSGGIGPYGIAGDPLTNQMIVTNRDTGNAFAFYRDTDGWKMLPNFELNDFGDTERTVPFEAVYNWNNQRYYITFMMPNGQWFVDVFERGGTYVRRIATVHVGSSGSDRDPNVGGSGMVINSETNNLFVADTAAGTVTVIGPDNTVKATIPVGSDPYEVAVNRVTMTVYVTLRAPNRIVKIKDTSP